MKGRPGVTARKVYFVYARPVLDEGQWQALSMHPRKRDATAEAKHQGPPYGRWQETRVIAGFDYEHPEALRA